MGGTDVVLDASAAVVLLVDADGRSDEVRKIIGDARITAPTVFPYEVANVIRGKLSGRIISADQAQVAWLGLAELDPDLFQWATLAPRVWQLRGSISAYDASYVALAEIMGCSLITADAKLAAMAPSTCRVDLITG